MKSNIKQAYNAVDSVIQEVLIAEEQALQGICFLLELENSKHKSKVVEALICILKQWNKIAASEIKAQVDELKKKIDRPSFMP